MFGLRLQKSVLFRVIAGVAVAALIVLALAGIFLAKQAGENRQVIHEQPKQSPPVQAQVAGNLPPPATGITNQVSSQPARVASAAKVGTWKDLRQPLDFLADGKILDTRSTDPDQQGRYQKLKLLQAKFKYPLLRVVETISRDPRTGAEKVLNCQAMVADHIMVKLRAGTAEDTLAQLAARHGGAIRKKMLAPGMYLVEFKGAQLDTVPQSVEAFTKEAEHIQYAEPDYIQFALGTIPNDSQFNELWGMHNEGQTGGKIDADIDAPEAWDLCTGSKSIVVGVIDTGVDYTHEDLQDNIWANPGETGLDVQGYDKTTNGLDDDNNGFVDDWHGWDFYNDDNDPFDDHSHGSHVSGTIGGVGNNGIGVAGVCWNISIVAFKFLSGGGYGSTSDAIDAVYYGTRIGVRLTSNSWGGGGFEQGLYDAIEDANTHGILFVAAAGNSSEDNDTAFNYPASYDNGNIIAVAATDDFDELAYFSCYGATTVDLGAPGVDILSSVPGNSYEKFKGTSMATPHVSGAAALAWAYHPTSTHLEIRDAILNGAEPIAALSGMTVTGGRLNVLNTLKQLGMEVLSSVPAANEVVFAYPTNFVVQFSDQYASNTISATDLLVNGSPANSVTLATSNSVTFRYVSSPVTNQGLQTMFMAGGGVTRLSDGEDLREWSATFRYDSILIAVTSTIPANGTLVTLPFTNLTLNLNEPVDPSSVDAADLNISQGTVTAARVVSSSTVAYGIGGVSEEKRLTIGIPVGALTDAFGNPNAAYSGGFDVDIGAISYPSTFELGESGGNLTAVSSSPQAFITPGGDTDTYTIQLDASQSVAVVASPAPTLKPSVWLRNTSMSLIGSNSASSAGQEAWIQAVAITNAGSYTIGLGGQGTTGAYAFAVYINTLLESETHGGGSNDTLQLAQRLDASPIQLAGGAAYAALAGRLNTGGSTNLTIMSANFESGLNGFSISNNFGGGGGLWHLTSARSADPGHSATGSLYYGRNERLPVGGDYDTGATNSGALYSPVIHVPLDGSASLNFKHFLATENRPDYDAAEIAVFVGTNCSVLLSSTDGTLPISSGGTWTAMSASLDEFAGMDVVVRFSFDTVDNIDNGFEGWYVDDVMVTASPVDEDWHKFSLATNESAMITLAKFNDDTPGLQLYDAARTLLATGTRDPYSGIEYITNIMGTSCYARVAGSGAEYSLALTKSAFFDLGGNAKQDMALDITGCKTVVGSIKQSGSLFGISGEFFGTPTVSSLDPANAAVGRSFEAPGSLVESECAFDGVNLWYSTGGWFYGYYFTGDVTIYKLNPITGDIRDFFTPGLSDTLTGLAWLDGELYATDGEAVYVYDDETLMLTRTLTPQWDSSIQGLSGDYIRGVIWGVSDWNHKIYKVDPHSGEILTEGAGINVGWENGMAVIGNEVYVSETDYNTMNAIAVYDADTLSLVRRMDVGLSDSLYGIGGDVGSSEDWYGFSVNSSDNLTIKTFTPAGDPQYPFELHNNLDPMIDLYDAAGAAVASNDNGGSDGKNALIAHIAQQAGAYTLRVRGAAKSVGEYVLIVAGATGSGGGAAQSSELLIYSETLDSDPGWMRAGRWAFGPPHGGGGSAGYPDPASSHTGTNVFGYNLSGDYENNITANYYLTTAAINCSGYKDVKLRFWRWLGIESSDQACIRVSNDGTTWSDVWENPSHASLTDGAWKQVEYDISRVADGRSTVYIRWGLGPTDGSDVYCGWNVDDVELVGVNLDKAIFFFNNPEFTVSETSGTAIVSVTRVGCAGASASVKHSTSNGTAMAGLDYGTATGTLWFAAGVMTNTFNVQILNDGTGEWDETLNLFLSASSTNSTLGSPSTAVLTVMDDDGRPGCLQFSSPLYSVNETDGVMNVTVTRTNGSWGTVTVEFSASNETAIAGSDYAATNGVLAFGQGVTSRTFSVSISNDTAVEFAETLRLRIRNPTGNAVLGATTSATLRIISDDNHIYHEYFDADPGWAAENQWQFGVPQGFGGSYGYPDPTSGYTGTNVYGYNLDGNYANNLATTYYLTTPAINCTNRENVTLRFQRWLDVEAGIYDRASIQVSKDGVNWVNVWENNDYTAVSDSKWTNVAYDISAVADNRSTVYVRLGMGPTDYSWDYCGWNIDDVELFGEAVFKDKARIEFNAASYEVMENCGTVVVTVARAWNTNIAASVNYATRNGTAASGADYAATTGTLLFAAGVTTNSVRVPIIDNSGADDDREFQLVLSMPSSNAVLGVQSNVTLAIVDDDQPGVLQFALSSCAVNETNGTLALTLVRDRGRRGLVSVDFATRDGTARAGSDYAATNGTLVFADNVTSRTVNVSLVNDTEVEPSETFYLDLSNPINGAGIGQPSYVMVTMSSEDGDILRNSFESDPGWIKQGLWQFGAPQGLGGNEGGYPDPASGHTGANVYGYNLEGDYLDNTYTPDYLKTPALNCADFENVKLKFWRWLGVEEPSYDHASVQVSDNNLSWTDVWTNGGEVADSQWKQVEYDISAVADRKATVYVRWGMGPTDSSWHYCGWNIDDVEVTGTPLATNMARFAFIFSTFQVTETQGLTWVSIARTGATNTTVNVGYAISNGTATAGFDYLMTNGSVSISAGLGNGAFSVPILNDSVGEWDETVNMYLFNPSSNAVLVSPSTAVLTIKDNDGSPGVLQFGSSRYFVDETNGMLKVLVTRTNGTANAVTVDFATRDGTAYAGSDYAATNGTLALGAGITNADITVNLVNDGDIEPPKTFTLSLSNPGGGARLGKTNSASITTVSEDGIFFYEHLDTNPVWTTQGEWQFGVPQGGGGGYDGVPDPVAGFTGANVYGYNLYGDYSDDMATTEYLTTPAINCSSRGNIKLNFWRWLGVENGYYDSAVIDVSNNGSNWTTVWSNENSVADSDWKNVEYDISAVADGHPTVYIRWGMGPTDYSWPYCGWNIDDVTVCGTVLTNSLVGFTVSDLRVSETCGTAYVSVLRTGVTNVMGRVSYATCDKTARAGWDYTSVSGTLWFTAGTISKTFSTPILNDTGVEGDETISVKLSNPSSGVVMGIGSNMTITITDDEKAGTFRFGSSVYNIGETGRQVSVTVERVDGSAGTVSVDYISSNGTAKAGVDYETVEGTLTLGAGVTNATITMAILDDSDVEATETASIHIGNPRGGATLGAFAAATVSIENDDGVIYHNQLNSDPAWGIGGQWSFGAPRGLGGSSGNPDPAAGHTGANVCGYNLWGDYAANLNTTYYLTTLPINCSAYRSVRLNFWRWLGVGYGWSDSATIEVSSNGTAWVRIWLNDDEVTDSAWTNVDYDISAVADGRSTVYLRWGMGPTYDWDGEYCGWNIDDVTVYGAPPATWIIEAVAGPNGTILPMGSVGVTNGGRTNFVITADKYFHVDGVFKDGVSVGVVTNYLWTNVTAYGTIMAEFEPDLAVKGTPHYWLAGHGLTNSTFNSEELLDRDGDGLKAWEEWIAGTIPTNQWSLLDVTAVSWAPGRTGIVVRWDSQPSRAYSVLSTTNISSQFDVLTDDLSYPRGSYTDTTHTAERLLYYKIKVRK